MERTKAGFDKTALINELLQGMEYAKELRNQFSSKTTNNSCSSSSSCSDDPNNNQALNFSLLEKMLSSFDKTILIATSNSPNNNNSCVSPKSKNSHLYSPSPKRRKAMIQKWSKSVQISNGGVVSGLEGGLEDGFHWRKYGQKHILGTRFPRGYYRCTHRFTKGCGATKQVQRSDDDPSIYQILYKGVHTCVQEGLQVQAQFNSINQAQMKSESQQSPSPQDLEVYVDLSPEGELKVESEQQAEDRAQICRPLSFTSAYPEPGPIDNYMLSFSSPAFGTPSTSESNFYPISPYWPHFGLTVQTSEIDNNEAFSGPESVTNSPIISDFEFPIDEANDIGIYFT